MTHHYLITMNCACDVTGQHEQGGYTTLPTTSSQPDATERFRNSPGLKIIA